MSEIELHRKLLGDARRNAAFHDALKASIVPGKTRVLDIGAGTGFLSFLARRLGAKHCTLIEYADTLDLAETLARRNRIDGLSFIKGHSLELRRKLAADLVVTETLGNYALEEGFLETALDARRFLAPGGTLLPSRLRQYACPVIDGRLQREIDIWPQVGYALDLEPARTIGLNNMYVKTVLPSDLGDAQAQCWDDLDLRPEAPAPSSRRQHTLRWSSDMLGSGTVSGFALWWECELLPGISLSTSPFAPATHWEQIYLPLIEAVELTAGDRLELTLLSDTRPDVGVRVTWKTRQLRDGKTVSEQSQDSYRGRL